MATVEIQEEDFVIQVDPSNLVEVTGVKNLPVRKWDPSYRAWTAPVNRENFDALNALGWIPDHLLEDIGDLELVSAVSISKFKNAVLLKSPPTPDFVAACRSLPDRRFFDGEKKAWVVSPTRRNLEHLVKAFPRAQWDQGSAELRDTTLAVKTEAERLVDARDTGTPEVVDYRFHDDPKPYAHQVEGFRRSKDATAYGLFMEPRTGKTRVIIDTATYLKARGKLNAVLVICPNSVKEPWMEEIAKMTPRWAEADSRIWDNSYKTSVKNEVKAWMLSKPHPRAVRWLIMNVEALSHASGYALAEEFVDRQGPTMVVVDESTRIKTPGSKRTKAVVKLRRAAAYRRIMTGTPSTQKGPLDYYAPFQFLDPRILGFNSFYSFRNHFAEMGGWENKEVIGYKNVEELQRLVDPFTYRVLRKDCMDLPEKVFEKRYVDLNPEQAKLYRDMKTRMVAEFGGKKITATIALTQMLRLQQIVGGFLPPIPPPELTDPDAVYRWREEHADEAIPIPGPNPKLNELLDLVEDVDGKVIIWSRFRPEIALITKGLRDKFGHSAVGEFHGGVSTTERTRYRLAFQDPANRLRFIVGQTETGGLGITLSEAIMTVYFSNSFSLESRLQSEDRQVGKYGGTYWDLVARATVDMKVLDTLRSNKNVADMVTGDDISNWI